MSIIRADGEFSQALTTHFFSIVRPIQITHKTANFNRNTSMLSDAQIGQFTQALFATIQRSIWAANRRGKFSPNRPNKNIQNKSSRRPANQAIYWIQNRILQRPVWNRIATSATHKTTQIRQRPRHPFAPMNPLSRSNPVEPIFGCYFNGKLLRKTEQHLRHLSTKQSKQS